MISMVERGAMRASTKPDAIRSAALRLFLGSGLRRTSMDAIAAEANVTKQTIYRYYGSKEQLFVEVLGGMAAGARTDVLEVMPSAPVTRDQLEKILLTTAQRILDRILDPKYLDLVRILIAEARDFPELARMFRAAAIEGVADALAELLQSEHTAAVVRVPDIQPALRLFVGPLLFAELEALLGDPAVVRQRTQANLPAVIELFVSAVSHPSRREEGEMEGEVS